MLWPLVAALVRQSQDAAAAAAAAGKGSCLSCNDTGPAVVLGHRVPDAAASSADAATSTAAGWVLVSVVSTFDCKPCFYKMGYDLGSGLRQQNTGVSQPSDEDALLSQIPFNDEGKETEPVTTSPDFAC